MCHLLCIAISVLMLSWQCLPAHDAHSLKSVSVWLRSISILCLFIWRALCLLCCIWASIGRILLYIPTWHWTKFRYNCSMFDIDMTKWRAKYLKSHGYFRQYVGSIRGMSLTVHTYLIFQTQAKENCEFYWRLCKSSRLSVPALCGKGNGETVFREKGW